jgi:hypothetical protein
VGSRAGVEGGSRKFSVGLQEHPKIPQAKKPWGYKTVSIGAVFDIATPTKKFNANTLTFSGEHRYVVRSESNNGIRGYIDADERFLNPANTISFGQDTATMFYQSAPYFTGDKIKIFTLLGSELTREIAVYLIAVMKKAFVNFAWGRSSFNVNILKGVQITLPITAEGAIDYDYMAARIRELEAARIRELEAYLKVTGLSDFKLDKAELSLLENIYKGGRSIRRLGLVICLTLLLAITISSRNTSTDKGCMSSTPAKLTLVSKARATFKRVCSLATR